MAVPGIPLVHTTSIDIEDRSNGTVFHDGSSEPRILCHELIIGQQLSSGGSSYYERWRTSLHIPTLKGERQSPGFPYLCSVFINLKNKTING